MRILSFDPGEHTAWVLWDHNGTPLGAGECKVKSPADFIESAYGLRPNGPVDVCVAEDQFKLPINSMSSFTALVERRAWVQAWVASVWPSCRHIQVQPALWMKQLGIEKGGDRQLFLGQHYPSLECKDDSVHLVDALLIGRWWIEHGAGWEAYQEELKEAAKLRRAKKAARRRRLKLESEE